MKIFRSIAGDANAALFDASPLPGDGGAIPVAWMRNRDGKIIFKWDTAFVESNPPYEWRTLFIVTRDQAIEPPPQQPVAARVTEWYASKVVDDDNGQTFIATVGHYPVNSAIENATHYEDTIYEVLGNTREECEDNLHVLMQSLEAIAPMLGQPQSPEAK